MTRLVRGALALCFAAAATQASAQALSARLAALAPGQWLSYDVPLQPGVHAPCCFEWDGQRDARAGQCRLDDRDWSSGHRDEDPLPVAGTTLRVLARRGPEGFDRLRAVASTCSVDAGRATVVEAGHVAAEDSLAFLAPAMTGGGHARGEAVMAIAHHAGAAADRVLAEAVRGDDRRLRRDVPFWLGVARGEPGLRTVRALLDERGREDTVNQLVFAVSVSPLAQARDELRTLARTHPQPRVRGEALFWLAQRHDEQADTLLEAALEDPSPHVRKKAVFALSQLPAARAVPALRRLVEHGKTREVRKEALFWLAQVDDDAVLPVFDALLGESK